jgi:2-polyprenyl-6-methoxyphenol hydroxylase-like FAD-dependent oxidoreductase
MARGHSSSIARQALQNPTADLSRACTMRQETVEARGDAPMSETISTQCCVAGGGPAGVMLGFLLARAGVSVVVLEKHADFFRDFRGDTVHPSTLELMSELRLIDAFLKVPHQKVETLSALVGEDRVRVADFRHLPTHCKFIALMPQWDFLNFLATQGRRYPSFDLRMKAEAVDLVEEGGRVAGVLAKTPEGTLTIRADLVVACDGRHSTLREKSGLQGDAFGAPMDVLWFRLSRLPEDGPETFGHIEAGRMMIMLDRGDYWQCAYIIAKGGWERIQAEGLPAFRTRVLDLSPFLGKRVEELRDWSDVKLLSVQVDRLRRWWRPGFLAIGDAAHAMSPIGGVGVNLAVQDAVAAGNRLAAPLRAGTASDIDLQAIQERREFAVKLTQSGQLFIQNRLISRVLKSQERPKAPALFKLFNVFPILRRIPARLVGLGVRPEHIHTPEMSA